MIGRDVDDAENEAYLDQRQLDEISHGMIGRQLDEISGGMIGRQLDEIHDGMIGRHINSVPGKKHSVW